MRAGALSSISFWISAFKNCHFIYQIENWHEQFDISMELSYCDGDNMSMMLAETIYMTITLKCKNYDSLVAWVFYQLYFQVITMCISNLFPPITDTFFMIINYFHGYYFFFYPISLYIIYCTTALISQSVSINSSSP